MVESSKWSAEPDVPALESLDNSKSAETRLKASAAAFQTSSCDLLSSLVMCKDDLPFSCRELALLQTRKLWKLALPGSAEEKDLFDRQSYLDKEKGPSKRRTSWNNHAKKVRKVFHALEKSQEFLDFCLDKQSVWTLQKLACLIEAYDKWQSDLTAWRMTNAQYRSLHGKAESDDDVPAVAEVWSTLPLRVWFADWKSKQPAQLPDDDDVSTVTSSRPR
ncbi:hypothetical protein QFC21_002505 [Naganishia friedmannii]|uniref:Uncharacterized protein n=1 Tax=Naganishia friedmannii TaxID=89922 RepID=A0ACC2VVB9_9TREE|nr:hypothetical protein QFC21_002505 [Naganishia friedmannii]